jgi:hypothetical protein
MRHSGEGRNPDGLSARPDRFCVVRFCRRVSLDSGLRRNDAFVWCGLYFLIFFLCAFPLTAHAAVPTVEQPIAVLRALDKMTARVEELEVPINQPLKFGTIMITVRTCRVTTPEETPEAAAYLEVGEFKPGEKDVPIFQGWMFASSPALSAMEHPVYDIWVTGCKTLTDPIKPK